MDSVDQPWQVQSLTPDGGELHQRIFDIDFEPDGVAWLAASDGLRRFDGFDWQNFGTNAGLPSSFIRSVRVAKNGELWVGSDAGAGVFDWRKKTYTTKGSEAGLAGPFVRRICEDPDGTLWFCSDQWPATTVGKGGLASLKNGKWATYSTSNGLPANYVINYFRTSTGRQFASTIRGWVQRNGEQWVTPLEPGNEQEDRMTSMAESGDGTLFLKGESTTLILRNGVWEKFASDALQLCSARNGSVYALCRNSSHQAWISMWDGAKFKQVSASFKDARGAQFYKITEAPDGSIWCIGSGTVIRWLNRADSWRFYPSMPSPVERDALGRVWFSGNSNVVVRHNGVFEIVPHLEKLMAVDRQGNAWGVRQKKLVKIPSTNLQAQGELISSTHPIDQLLIDGAGSVWGVGEGEPNHPLVGNWDASSGTWLTIDQFKGMHTVNASPDPTNGLWLVLQESNGNCQVVHVAGASGDWKVSQPEKAPLMYPSLFVGAGRQWLRGFDGLFERAQGSTNAWTRVASVPGGLQASVDLGQEVLFSFSGGRGGIPGCAVFSNGRWISLPGYFEQASASADRQTLYMSSSDGLFVRQGQGNLDLVFLPAPVDAYIAALVVDQDKTLWVGTSDGLLQYIPSASVPRARVQAVVSDFREDAGMPVTATGRHRFGGASPTNAFSYSWRIDGQQWSGFSSALPMPISTTGLKTGSHVLEMRARDADGNTQTDPTSFHFTISPVPLQQKTWFVPMTVLVLAALGMLSWLAWTRARQIAARNEALKREVAERIRAEAELEKARDGLEVRVAERTSELARSNTALSAEILEREAAEKKRRLLEEQLRQAQKMEAVGTLAGGIAHDFNNLLASIIPNTQMAIEEANGKEAVVDHLQQVLVASERAANLVRQILMFSRRKSQTKALVDILPIVKETVELMRSALPASVEISLQINPPVASIEADATQIHQVLVNLCTNAGHAMKGRSGRLHIKVETVDIGEDKAAQHADFRPGSYTLISVADNGCGIRTEDLVRVFDPFFTTKAPGEGTGLGLAVVHGIVKDHSGVIQVDSQLGMGTRFDIYLPASRGLAKGLETETRKAVPGRGQHILIVDDEAAICAAFKALLTRNGYRATVCARPQEALRVFEDAPGDYDLVFTDLTMPGMTGIELAAGIRNIRPDALMILATGHGGFDSKEAELMAGFHKVLLKPLAPQAMLAAVHEALQAKNAGKSIG